ncbi:MAG: ptpA 11 [Gemmatimonadetes bacterium]|nr:ptpA 11 [Gemmatimonadota bacterium]
MRSLTTGCILLGLFTAPAASQVPAPLSDMVRRVFATNEFGARQRFGPVQWTEGGSAYLTVEPAPETRGGFDIVRYQTATGARTVFVAAADLVPAGQTAPLDIEAYTVSAEGRQVLIFTNSERVWRDNTRGDYWLLDRTARTLKKLGGPEAPPSSLMYAKLAPTGDRVAYVRGGEIYVEHLANGTVTRLTSGADSLHVNGMTDWVYEEEFGLRDGFRWSPDGTRIAYWHFDMTGVGTFKLINTTDSIYPIVTPIQYPKVGTSNSAVTVGVVPAAGGPTTWIAVPDDPRENYIPRMEWAGPTEVVIQRINRPQNTNRVLLADVVTGRVTVALTERDDAWLDVVDDLTWLSGGKEFLWLSERDGWRHLYRVSRDGAKVALVTPGAYDVVSVASVDEAQGHVYFIASPDNPTQRYLYRARLDGKGTAERLSPVAQPGTHRYDISPDARWAFHTWSSANTLPTTGLVSLPKHTALRTMVDDTLRRAAVQAVLPKQPMEFFRVDAGEGLMLDGWMIRPRNFDSTQQYPVLVYVYGEPAGQTVVDQWGGGSTIWYQAIADQGYVVVSFDNRGTPAPRGRAWRKSVYQQVGVLSSRDQAEALRALTRSRPYLDPGRVAIWGWSGGGSSTLQAMFRYPDLYQVGMAVASVPDELLYDTIYQERYMGVPGPGAEAYRKASAINYAEGLRGRLLIVHGSGDDNVHYQGSERLVNRLVQLGKPFDFMAYPNRSHCICEGPGTTAHIYSLLTRYLVEHLPAGGRPRSAP